MFRVELVSIQTATEASTIPPTPILRPASALLISCATNLLLRGGYGIFFVPNYYGPGPNIGFSQGTPWVTTLNGGLNPLDSQRKYHLGICPAHFQTGKWCPRAIPWVG